MILSAKDSGKKKIELENQRTYEIPYSNFNKSYVSQTSRRISVNAVKKNYTNTNFSLAQHIASTKHILRAQKWLHV